MKIGRPGTSEEVAHLVDGSYGAQSGLTATPVSGP